MLSARRFLQIPLPVLKWQCPGAEARAERLAHRAPGRRVRTPAAAARRRGTPPAPRRRSVAAPARAARGVSAGNVLSTRRRQACRQRVGARDKAGRRRAPDCARRRPPAASLSHRRQACGDQSKRPASGPARAAPPCRPAAPAARAARVSSAATVTLRNTSIAVSSPSIGTACASTMPPASACAVIACRVAPVSRSPRSTAQLTGARPRYIGSSEPCML